MPFFGEYKVKFKQEDSVYNLMTLAVLPEKVEQDLLVHSTEGERMYWQFIAERLHGGKSIWDKMKDLGTFKRLQKVVPVQSKDQVVKLREEREVMTRFIIVAMKRSKKEFPNFL